MWQTIMMILAYVLVSRLYVFPFFNRFGHVRE